MRVFSAVYYPLQVITNIDVQSIEPVDHHMRAGAKVQITLLCQTICNNACNEIATNIMLTSQM